VFGIDRRGASHSRWTSTADSLVDPYAVHRAFEAAGREIGTIDALVHLANHTNVHAATPEQVLRENLAVNASVFQAAIERGVKRIVFASSVQAVLGGIGRATDDPRVTRPLALPISEQTEPRPTNGYGLSKLLSERMLDGLTSSIYDEQGDTSAISLRMPYVLDQGSFEGWASRGPGSHDYRWGGCECYSYIHLDDIAEACIAAIDAAISNSHEVFWVAAPDPRIAESVMHIAQEHFAGVPGVEAAVAADSFMDCSKAARMLGWAPKRLLRDRRAEIVGSR
jgi:UDP-glucose 4-epimerase